METAVVDGVRITYRRAGSGPAVVLVHGGACDSRMWTPQLDTWTTELDVVAWDEPGAGGSDDLPEGFGLADYGSHLIGFLRALDLAPAHLVGLSWGTTVLLEAWRQDRSVVRSLVLADGYAGWRGSLGGAEADSRLAGVREALSGPAEHIDPTLPGLLAGPPSAETARILAAMAADVRPASMLAALTAMAAADLTDVLPTIDVPTLLVWGELDVRSPLAVARDFERLVPRARLEVIPECGHMANLEAPDAFDAVVHDFLRTA